MRILRVRGASIARMTQTFRRLPRRRSRLDLWLIAVAARWLR